jgi:hypothetical protein
MPITKRLHPNDNQLELQRKNKQSIPVECFHFDHLRINFSFKGFELLNLFFNSLDICSERSHTVEFFLCFLQELN